MAIGMPQTHDMISNVTVFFEEAKTVRKRKAAGEIGRTLQHEIVVAKWKKYFDEGIGRRILGGDVEE